MVAIWSWPDCASVDAVSHPSCRPLVPLPFFLASSFLRFFARSSRRRVQFDCERRRESEVLRHEIQERLPIISRRRVAAGVVVPANVALDERRIERRQRRRTDILLAKQPI